MVLPEMTGLQYLVVGLLLSGAKNGREIRRRMSLAGVHRKPAAFSRLMKRMESEVYVVGEYRSLRQGDQVVRQRCYAVTDFGLMQWKATRQFYAAPAGPAADLVPVATEKGELAHYPPRTRKAIIRRRLAKQFPELFPPKRRR